MGGSGKNVLQQLVTRANKKLAALIEFAYGRYRLSEGTEVDIWCAVDIDSFTHLERRILDASSDDVLVNDSLSFNAVGA